MGSVAERDTPPPDYSPTASTPPIPRDRSLSPISELDTREEKLVKQTQYYFGDHVIERSKPEAEPETKATSKCSKQLLGTELWEVVVNHLHLWVQHVFF